MLLFYEYQDYSVGGVSFCRLANRLFQSSTSRIAKSNAPLPRRLFCKLATKASVSYIMSILLAN